MKRKRKHFIAVILSGMMIFSTTGFAFADVDLDNPPSEPTKPQVEDYQDNGKIKEYNQKAEEYNKQVDEYNTAVDNEYNNAVIETNQKNIEGQQKQIDSQKAYDNVIKENEEIDKYNQAIDEQYEKDIAQYNLEKEQYNKDMENYTATMEQYRSDLNEKYGYEVYQTIEEYKALAESWNAIFERDKGYHEKSKNRGIVNKTNNINELPTNFNELVDTENPQTITVIKGESSNPDNQYKVITIALYTVGSNIYYGNEYPLETYGTLNPDMYNSIVQAKWESVTVGDNDTVIVQSENNLMIKYTNGNFFNYTNEDFTEGYWHLASTERGDMKVLDWSWRAIYSQTGFNKNIYIIYTYDWQGKYPIAVMPIAPTEVQKGEYKDKIELPEIFIWKNLPNPIKREYLTHISLLDLFSKPILKNTNNSVVSANTITYYGAGDEVEPISATISNTKTPLIAPKEEGAWAFINLLAVLANFIICIFLLVMIFINNRKEDDETEVKNRILGRICSLIIAIVSGIIFLLTEDMSLPMVWVDQWTVLMICTFVLQLIVGFLSKHKEKDKI